jgi:murein DD-endopeptidase MepM/ murein hydrolase activator NlpD
MNADTTAPSGPTSPGRSPERGASDPTPRPRRLRRWLCIAGFAVVFVAASLGAVSGLVALPLMGGLLAGVADPSLGPLARPVSWSGRTAAIVTAMVIGFAVMVTVPSGPGGGFLLSHLSRDTAELVVNALLLIATAVIALPLAMTQAPEPVETVPLRRAVATRRNLVLATAGALTLALGHVFGVTFVVLAAAAVALPVLTAGSRAWDVFRLRATTDVLRGPLHRGQRARVLQALNLVVFWALVAVATLPGTFDPLLDLGIVSTPAAVRGIVVAGCGLAAVLALVPRRRVLVGTNLLVASASILVASQLVGIYHGPVDPVTLPSPVTGQWYVVQGGRAELVNNHRAGLAQDDALDILQFVGNRTHHGDARVLANYFCYGGPVLAPAAGRVVTLVSDRPDQRIGTTDTAHPAGNHLVIDIGGGRYVAFAHLRSGSVTVALGETVRPGQQVGEVGNSGNSDEPHLHFQVQNRPQFNVITPAAGARTYPWLLRDVVLTRSGATSRPSTADLRRGDYFAPAAQ